MSPAQRKLVRRLKSGRVQLLAIDQPGGGRTFFLERRFDHSRRRRGPVAVLASTAAVLIRNDIIEPCEAITFFGGTRIPYRLKT